MNFPNARAFVVIACGCIPQQHRFQNLIVVFISNYLSSRLLRFVHGMDHDVSCAQSRFVALIYFQRFGFLFQSVPEETIWAYKNGGPTNYVHLRNCMIWISFEISVLCSAIHAYCPQSGTLDIGHRDAVAVKPWRRFRTRDLWSSPLQHGTIVPPFNGALCLSLLPISVPVIIKNI